MQFSEGQRVYSADQQEVGRITHVVLNPENKWLMHVVVRQGLIFTEDRLIPVELFDFDSPDRALLREDVDPQSLPRFHQLDDVPPDFGDIEGWRVPTIVEGGRYVLPSRKVLTGLVENVPDEGLVVRQGAQVISEDHQPIGHIDAVMIYPQTSYAAHFVIVQGLLWKTRRRVPAFWCDIVTEDELHLALDARGFEALPEYSMIPA